MDDEVIIITTDDFTWRAARPVERVHRVELHNGITGERIASYVADGRPIESGETLLLTFLADGTFSIG